MLNDVNAGSDHSTVNIEHSNSSFDAAVLCAVDAYGVEMIARAVAACFEIVQQGIEIRDTHHPQPNSCSTSCTAESVPATAFLRSTAIATPGRRGASGADDLH